MTYTYLPVAEAQRISTERLQFGNPRHIDAVNVPSDCRWCYGSGVLGPAPCEACSDASGVTESGS